MKRLERDNTYKYNYYRMQQRGEQTYVLQTGRKADRMGKRGVD
jgi:hypothetical protein